MSQFTVTVKGGGLIDSTTEKNIIQAATYVGNLLDRYIVWKGVLDIEVQVKPSSALTWSTANGLLPALGQITWTGSGWTNSTLEECLTGVDTNTKLPDAGCTIYLGSDGTAKFKGTLSTGISIESPAITSGTITGSTVKVTAAINSSALTLTNDSLDGDNDSGAGGTDVSEPAAVFSNTTLTLSNGIISSDKILQLSGASYTEILSGGTQSAMFNSSKSSLTFSTGLYLGNPNTSSSSSMQNHSSPYITVDARMRLRRGAPLTYPGGTTGAYVRNIYIKQTANAPSATTGYVGDIMITY